MKTQCQLNPSPPNDQASFYRFTGKQASSPGIPAWAAPSTPIDQASFYRFAGKQASSLGIPAWAAPSTPIDQPCLHRPTPKDLQTPMPRSHPTTTPTSSGAWLRQGCLSYPEPQRQATPKALPRPNDQSCLHRLTGKQASSLGIPAWAAPSTPIDQPCLHRPTPKDLQTPMPRSHPTTTPTSSGAWLRQGCLSYPEPQRQATPTTEYRPTDRASFYRFAGKQASSPGIPAWAAPSTPTDQPGLHRPTPKDQQTPMPHALPIPHPTTTPTSSGAWLRQGCLSYPEPQRQATPTTEYRPTDRASFYRLAGKQASSLGIPAWADASIPNDRASFYRFVRKQASSPSILAWADASTPNDLPGLHRPTPKDQQENERLT